MPSMTGPAASARASLPTTNLSGHTTPCLGSLLLRQEPWILGMSLFGV